MRQSVALRNSAGQQYDFGDHQLGHAARVRKGRVEDRHAERLRRIQIHLVGADAETADTEELGRASEHWLGELGR